jgi:hypothetical protein
MWKHVLIEWCSSPARPDAFCGHIMKSLLSTSFFLSFERIVRHANPDLAQDRWLDHGVEWERVRHNFSGPAYGYALETFIATHTGKRAWALIITKERWWAGKYGENIKTQQWARPLHGNRKDIMGWFTERQRKIVG